MKVNVNQPISSIQHKRTKNSKKHTREGQGDSQVLGQNQGHYQGQGQGHRHLRTSAWVRILCLYVTVIVDCHAYYLTNL